MSDAITRLNAALEGRYRIERELGEGGMAMVYLADDLRHERKVALKVLKPELAAVVGAERFLTEIKTTAKLQHPHILPLHDSGNADGFLFYVMPYVEGETLRDRIDREKQLPVSEALGIATAVAGALQVAHDHGIIHRDVKPGNILLSRGQPLVADFGIALAVGAAGGSRLTETGLSVGTPYYMSPEQATGDQTVGPASDTYALACVLYEMLVGEPPYLGNTAQAVLGKIIQGVPVSPTSVRKSVPANVDAAIRRGLEKLPADRFSRAEDFARALADPSFRHGEPTGVGAAGGAGVGPWNRLSVGLAGLAAALALALGWSAFAPEPPTPLRAAKRFEIRIGATQPIAVANVHALAALSPDGATLVYSANLGDGARLYVRAIEQLESRELVGTDNAYAPFFSPDGQWVAYHDPFERRLEKVSIRGGQPLVISDAWPPNGGTWLEDGTIVFGSQGQASFRDVAGASGLFRVSESGGTPERLTTVDEAAGEAIHDYPHALPGGRTVIFTAKGPDGGAGRVVALSLETGEQRTVVDVGYDARYAASGHLVFARQDALWAVPFDARRLETTGPEVVVVQDLEMNPYWVSFAFSGDGLLAYMAGGASITMNAIPRALIWVDREGREQALPLPERQYYGPRLSPDGSRVAVTVYDGRSSDLWVYDVASGAGLRLTRLEATADAILVPVWTPDGERIIYRAPGSGDLWWTAADGSGAPEPLFEDPGSDEAGTSVSPDGRTLVFSRILDPPQNLHREVWQLPLEGARTPAPLLSGEFAYANSEISPDGRWLAYTSNESGQFEVYIQPYPGPGAKTPVSIGGGGELVWAPDGRELYYRVGTRMMVASVQTQPTLRVSQPRVLFEGSQYTVSGGGARQYHVAPDGRFLMIRPGETPTSAGGAPQYDHFVVVENWFDELRRLAPVD